MRNFILSLSLIFYVVTLSAQSSSKEEYLVTINTSKGDIYILLNNEAPKHKEAFIKYVESGKLTGKTFFKAVGDLILQGGAKEPDEKGLKKEASLPQKRGAISATADIDPDTRSKTTYVSSFYIVRTEEGLPYFDKTYMVFGQVVKGMDVVDANASLPKDTQFNLTEEVTITASVKLLKKKKITKLTGFEFDE